MSHTPSPLEPIQSSYRVPYLSAPKLDRLQAATLEILERTGVRFPSDKALTVLAEHGAHVDRASQIVKFPRNLVFKALATAPRYFAMGGREPIFDFHLRDGWTYFTTDGCGVETIDMETRQRRPSCKADVGLMARVATLKKAGAEVVAGSNMVRFPRALVEEALRLPPKKFKLGGRRPGWDLDMRVYAGVDSGAAKDLFGDVAQAGPGGNFLKSRQTRLAARSDEFFCATLFDRRPQ